MAITKLNRWKLCKMFIMKEISWPTYLFVMKESIKGVGHEAISH